MADSPLGTLERAAHDAAADVLRLLEAQYAEHDITSDRARLAAAVAQLQDDPERGALLLVRPQPGEPAIALAALSFTSSLEHSARVAWLEELYVVPEQRGRGLGAALLERAARLACEAGCRTLELEVTADHLRAEHLYARSGFEPLHRNRWLRRLAPALAPRRVGTALDHVELAARDLAGTRAFYDAALTPLALLAHPLADGSVGYGPAGPTPLEGLALRVRRAAAPDALAAADPRVRIALRAPHRDAVRAFHAAALSCGGRDLAAPGLRAERHPHCYAAAVADPDGHVVEAICHTPELDSALGRR